MVLENRKSMQAYSKLIEQMRMFHEGRLRSGIRRKYERMAEGPFEFFRGTDFLFARAWPELQPRSAGPAILTCGDLHLENFGAFFTDDGDVRFDINDFDEAAIVPCSLDLVRCSTSILLAAESWKLTPTQATGMVLTFLDSYSQAVVADSSLNPAPEDQPDLAPLRPLMEAVRLGSMQRVVERHTKLRRDGTRRFRRNNPRFAKEKSQTREAIIAALAADSVTQKWQVLGITRRFSGIGSLGLRRYELLVRRTEGDELFLMSMKESIPSVMEPFADLTQPKFDTPADRQAWAQRVLQGKPTAGLCVVNCCGRSFRLRAAIPEENRSSLNRLQKDPVRLRTAVSLAGRLTARSHYRGCAVSGKDRAVELHQWAKSPALEAVLAAAVRFADWVQRDYSLFMSALSKGALRV
jgi:uncharacterized protein (DUF2252 family)